MDRFQLKESLSGRNSISGLEEAILHTVAYADVFDFPLKREDIHRYLIGVQTSPDAVREALETGNLVPDYLYCHEDLFLLPGRNELITLRGQRALNAAFLWPRAERYGRIISSLPFVRMVAITGALAMDNEDQRDIDYLIVTEVDRLWLCRGLVILLARWAYGFGDQICPNYFLTERVLRLSDQNLYTAHELVQMVPIYGWRTYWKMRQANAWVSGYLPNANGSPRRNGQLGESLKAGKWKDYSECLLRLSPGEWVENWERKRKLNKFNALRKPGDEAAFSADVCKGHFTAYGRHAIDSYTERITSNDILGG